MTTDTSPPPGGRSPSEPSGPSSSRGDLRRVWLLGWSVAAAAALVALATAWVVAPRIELLGVLGTLAAICVSVALHHLVVTSDLGERTIPRPAEVDEFAAFRSRRRVVGGLAAAGLLGAGAIAGLLRFGPRAPEGTAWQAGSRLTTIDGRSIRPDDVPLGGVVTAWPEAAVGSELSAVMLIRLRDAPDPPTMLDGVVDETLVAYSRLCTHAGCAVALYRDVDQALFCPCHQATFDARRGAEPVFGPASHPLPQLPLGIDGEGYVIATGDLSAPPGAVGGSV